MPQRPGMLREDEIRLRHMLEAAQTAVEFARGRARDDFAADRMLLFAVVRALEIVGEAAGKVSEATRVVFPQIPWRAVVGMRNHLIHGYFDIDTEVVWRTVSDELPGLIVRLQEGLDQ